MESVVRYVNEMLRIQEVYGPRLEKARCDFESRVGREVKDNSPSEACIQEMIMFATVKAASPTSKEYEEPASYSVFIYKEYVLLIPEISGSAKSENDDVAILPVSNLKILEVPHNTADCMENHFLLCSKDRQYRVDCHPTIKGNFIRIIDSLKRQSTVPNTNE